MVNLYGSQVLPKMIKAGARVFWIFDVLADGQAATGGVQLEDLVPGLFAISDPLTPDVRQDLRLEHELRFWILRVHKVALIELDHNVLAKGSLELGVVDKELVVTGR